MFIQFKQTKHRDPAMAEILILGTGVILFAIVSYFVAKEKTVMNDRQAAIMDIYNIGENEKSDLFVGEV